MEESGKKETTILELAKRLSDQLLIMQNNLSDSLKRNEEKDNKEPKAVGKEIIPNVLDEITTVLEWNINKLDELLMVLRSQVLNRLS